MPYRYVHLQTGAVRDPLNNPAEIGTLMLELGTVSRLTGDRAYYDAAKRAVRQVWQRRSSLGLVGEVIDVRTGEWENTASHVGGRIDSWYEYLLKAWLLFGDDEFRTMYEPSIAAVHRHLADERFDGLWYGRVDMNTGDRLATTFGALEAFLPAVLALDGDTARAARLQESVARRLVVDADALSSPTGGLPTGDSPTEGSPPERISLRRPGARRWGFVSPADPVSAIGDSSKVNELLRRWKT